MHLSLRRLSCSIVCLVCDCSVLAAPFSANLLRNGGFEFDLVYNGSCMDARPGGRPYELIGIEGWLAGRETYKPDRFRLVSGKGNVVSGSRALEVEGPSTLDSVPTEVQLGPVAFDLLASASIRTSGVKGRFYIAEDYGSPVSSVELPANTDGLFTPISLALNRKTPPRQVENRRYRVGFQIESGVASLDDVQLEVAKPGEVPSAFSPQAGEILGLAVDGFALRDLPSFYADNPKFRLRTGTRRIEVRNLSGWKLDGTLNLYFDSWRSSGQTLWRQAALNDLESGGVLSFDFNPGKLAPDAYVVTAEILRDGETLLSGRGVVDLGRSGNGIAGKSMLLARNAMRLTIFPGIPASERFGVGNALIHLHEYYDGYTVSGVLDAKAYAPVVAGGFGDSGSIFWAAVEGCEETGIENIDAVEDRHASDALRNPIAPGELNVFSPEGKAELLRRAQAAGRKYGTGPGIAAVKLRNESVFLNRGSFCPTAGADADFRGWCRMRFGNDLAALNDAWGTAFGTWEEVAQPVSGHDFEAARLKEKEGAEAVDWTAQMGRMSPEARRLMHRHPGQTMDWLRWRTRRTLDVFTGFIAEAKKLDTYTLYGNNYCWPNFWPQVTLPFWRRSDFAALDLSYSTGMPKTLGTCDEMIDILEMAESTVPDKPIWGWEVYVQPSFDPAFVALQNWGMVAHGMTVNLVFAWRPYSDHGQKVFKDGPGAWLKPDSPPMWMLLDTDGTKLPVHEATMRSKHEIEVFDHAFDGRQYRRRRGRTAIYLSNDTSEFVVFETDNAPFRSLIVHARTTVSSVLRFGGVRLEYLDDERLGELGSGHYDTLLLPPTPVLSQVAAKAIAAFAKAGGTVVLLGPTGIYDPWLRPYPCPGGGAWRELGWPAVAEWAAYPRYLADLGSRSASQLAVASGTPFPTNAVIQHDAILGDYAAISWGRGRMVCLSKYPCRYDPKPHFSPELEAYAQKLQETAALDRPAYWTLESAVPEDSLAKRQGEGAPMVDVVLRDKVGSDGDDVLLFVLNQGGGGTGMVTVPGQAGCAAVDAIDGMPVAGVSDSEGNWTVELDLPPYGYRVIHLQGRQESR